MTDYTKITDVLDQAQEALRSFDDQVNLVNSMPYPIELYELIGTMHEIISEKIELDKEQKEQGRVNRFAIEELTDRLSDALSKNITLTVRLRAAEEDKVIADNQAAADAFIDDVISSLFKPQPSSEGTKQ